MILWLLRKLLGLVSTEDLAFRVGQAKEEYLLSLEEVEDGAQRAGEVLGAIMFVAGQQLSVVQQVVKEAGKAKDMGGEDGKA